MSASNGSNGTAENVRPDHPGLRTAAELKWSDPHRTWDEIAGDVGISVRQLHRWRQTEAWEITLREVGSSHLEKLAPLAVDALVKQWAKGNAQGAIDVLRSFGFLRPEQREVNVNLTEKRDLDAEILAKLGYLPGS